MRRRAGTRHRALATRVLLGLLVLLVLTWAWLALGLLEARRDLQVGAAGVRAEEAAARVRAARSSLQVAAAVPDRPELRVAARLPGLGGGVDDTRPLLAAAGDLTTAADLAEAGVGGHLRAYAADPALERLLARHRLDGAPRART